MFCYVQEHIFVYMQYVGITINIYAPKIYFCIVKNSRSSATKYYKRKYNGFCSGVEKCMYLNFRFLYFKYTLLTNFLVYGQKAFSSVEWN